MPWQNSPEDRQRSNATYGADWRRARRRAMERAAWKCQIRMEGCQGAATQVDHITPVSQGGGHDLANLRAARTSCHGKVTAAQGEGPATILRLTRCRSSAHPGDSKSQSDDTESSGPRCVRAGVALFPLP
jgi:5-methylcytosine-specific restriction endonuclease McrA